MAACEFRLRQNVGRICGWLLGERFAFDGSLRVSALLKRRGFVRAAYESGMIKTSGGKSFGSNRLLLVGDEGECGFDLFGYGARSSAGGVHEYPVGLTLRNESAVG